MVELAKVRVTVRFRLKKWPQMIILDMSSIIPIFALLKNYNILGLLYSSFSHTYLLQSPQKNSNNPCTFFVWADRAVLGSTEIA